MGLERGWGAASRPHARLLIDAAEVRQRKHARHGDEDTAQEDRVLGLQAGAGRDDMARMHGGSAGGARTRERRFISDVVQRRRGLRHLCNREGARVRGAKRGRPSDVLPVLH